MRTIALDIGNVCLSIHPERCFGTLGYHSMMDVPRTVIELAGQRFERGELTAEEFLHEFRYLTGCTLPDSRLKESFCSIIGEPVPGMNELVASLPERNFRVVFFSDTSSLHLEVIWEKFPASAMVSGGIYSFEVGAKKPELPMFEVFEEEYGVPDFYFDDRADLIEGALLHGWNAHRFTGAQQMAKILSEINVQD